MQETQVDSVLIFGLCQFNFHQLSLQLPLQPNNPYIKQLLYEVEHDIMNYQCQKKTLWEPNMDKGPEN